MRRSFKKVFALLLSLLMVFSLAACGGKTEDADTTDGGKTTQGDTKDNDSKGSEDTPATATPEPTQAVEETYDFGGVTVKAFNGIWNNLKGEEVGLVYQEAKKYVDEKYNINLQAVDLEGYDGYNDAELLLSSVASGDPAAHLVSLNPESLMSCILNDLLFDITDHLDMYKVGSVYTDAMTWDDRCYGITYDNVGDTWVMVYDRNLLKDIGMVKTPTDMFMEGKWDYESFKSYLAEMKSKLPDGVYPIGAYPLHWGIMAGGANGAVIMDSRGNFAYNNEAFIEAAELYQELQRDGLAAPATPVTRDDGTIGYSMPYAVDDETIVLKRAEPWQLSGLSYEYGIVYYPWGSNVTCTGDYTTLSDNYKVSLAYWGGQAVLKAAADATGITGEVLTKITQDFEMACNDKTWMQTVYEAEKSGGPVQIGAEYGQARSFHTEQDIELFDWAHGRFEYDWSWCFDSAGLITGWNAFRDIYAVGQDARSTLESYYNEGIAKMKDAGLIK